VTDDERGTTTALWWLAGRQHRRYEGAAAIVESVPVVSVPSTRAPGTRDRCKQVRQQKAGECDKQASKSGNKKQEGDDCASSRCVCQSDKREKEESRLLVRKEKI